MVKRALPLLLLTAVGCSALVRGETPQSTRCDPAAEGNPCLFLGVNFECRPVDGEPYGECRSNLMVPEMCDNDIDDDGDGMVDEGVPEICDRSDNDCDDAVDEGIDLDGDGFAGCVGSEFFEDCNDDDPNVRPDASVAEVCDGVDNDCDGTTVDGEDECGPMEICQPPGGCQSVDCSNSPLCDPATEFCDRTLDPPACRPSDTTCLGSGGPCTGVMNRCDPGSGVCIEPLPNGSPCATDAQCLSDQCVLAGVVRLRTTDLGGQGICANLCCSDTQCGQGEVCWDSGSGTRVCLPETIVSSEPQDVPVCSDTSQCTGSDRCALASENIYQVDDRLSAACRPDLVAPFPCTTLGQQGACQLAGGRCVGDECFYHQCFGAGDCPTGACAGRCREICGSTEDCQPLSGLPSPTCAYVNATGPGGRRDFIGACLYESRGQLGSGSPCTDDDECTDMSCVNDLGGLSGERSCRTRCCTDANCQPAEQCRPVQVGMAFYSLCMPRPVFGPGGP